MNHNEKMAIGIYIVLSLITIVVLIVLLSRKKKEGFKNQRKVRFQLEDLESDKPRFKTCFCTQKQGGREKVCTNVNAGFNSYQKGITENTPNWKKPEWTSVFPGDVTFPKSQGCSNETSEGYTYLENQKYSGEIVM